MSETYNQVELDSGKVRVGTKLKLIEDTSGYHDNRIYKDDVVYLVGYDTTGDAILGSKNVPDVTGHKHYSSRGCGEHEGMVADYAYLRQIFEVVGD